MEGGRRLEATSHVTKLVTNSKVHKEPIVIVDGGALRPRPNEGYMSVNWLEYDGDNDLKTCLQKIILILEKKLNVKDNHWLPVINVKKAIDRIKTGTSDNRLMQFLYKPEFKPDFKWDDPSHSGVYGYSHSHEDALIGDLMAEVVEPLHKAKDYK